MPGSEARDGAQRGQMLVLFILVLSGIVLAVGLVIDGGYALAQRRGAQNASDFAALAGARIVAEKIGGDASNGTDANVQQAIANSIAINHGTAITFGSPSGPQYVDSSGTPIGFVGNGSIPAAAVGVTVSSNRSWRPFFLGVIGIGNWTATADATAKGGYAAGGPSGPVFPIGLAQAFFDGRRPCSGDINLTTPSDPCYPQHLTPGGLNVPGGFGWLKFGCAGYGLGQTGSGCSNSKPFLQSEIGPPGNSYGCCTAVDQTPGAINRIGSLPGNKASADCSAYTPPNNVTLWVPVWTSAAGNGSNAYYNIVGFTGFQITSCNGGKDIQGVWRVPFTVGPTTTTPGFAGAPLAVQLIR